MEKAQIKVDVLLKEGYISYVKNGKIEVVKPPEFGSVKLIFQDGKHQMNEVLTKTK